MKMIYNGVPINSMKVKHYELNTNDCDMIASDLQAGKTAVARGKKITGTGKSFEFARYGLLETNLPLPIPNNINVVEIACLNYPVQLTVDLSNMKTMDFTAIQSVANVIIDGTSHPIKVQANNNMITVSCDRDIALQVFYGKDNYI